MDYNQIDVLSKGTIWQGGSVDEAIEQPPFVGPILIVCMDKGEANEQWINHSTVELVTAVWIEDAPDACLKDEVLLGLVDMSVVWLQRGNIYGHCAAGVSRASYWDIAVHMRAMKWTYQAAFEEIKSRRPIADPNPGFVGQLQRLEPVLMGVSGG